MEPINKALPHSVEIEEQVIVSCIYSHDVLEQCMEMLEPADFYVSRHQKIFEIMHHIYSGNGPVDLVTVSERIIALEDDGIKVSYLADILGSVPISVNPGYDAAAIKGYSGKRMMIKKAIEVQQMCFDGMSKSEDIINHFQEGVLDIGMSGSGGTVHIGDSVQRIKKKIEDLNNGIVVNDGVSTGFKYLDTCLGKMQKGDLIILAARPSMGKTTLAMNIAANVARDLNVAVDVFSIETSTDKISTRLICAESRVDSMVFKHGMLSKQDYERLTSGSEMVETYPIYIDDSPVLSSNELVRRCRKAKKEHDTGLIVVDYLQFMKASGDHSRKDLEIGAISRAAKQIAKELNVPLIMLSQLNRSLENRLNKRPVMSDLRESGAIEQDADVIAFIYRDEVYNKDDQNNKGKAEVIIAKNRDGITADVPMEFVGKFTRFEDINPVSSY